MQITHSESRCDKNMKKIGLGISILLFAAVLSLSSSGTGLLTTGIGAVGLIFSVIGFLEKDKK